jgi:AraC-like DNA-binding protein
MAPSQPGLERIEACFAGRGYDPHRHDTYAIGVTLDGVQSFDYRGETLNSLAGQAIVLHPDEMHDGRAGTDVGFRYRLAYIAPKLIQAALGWRSLPFARRAVTDDARLLRILALALEDLERPIEDLQLDQIVAEIADALAAVDSSAKLQKLDAPAYRAVGIARDFLDAHTETSVTSAQLEAVTGIGRYTLARHFRACLGTSPYRYVTMRRLDRARRLIASGVALADAAAASGFADQAHMTRQFKNAYGMSPGRWRATATLAREAGREQ